MVCLKLSHRRIQHRLAAGCDVFVFLFANFRQQGLSSRRKGILTDPACVASLYRISVDLCVSSTPCWYVSEMNVLHHAHISCVMHYALEDGRTA